jgi:hypothetical protein
MMAAAIALPAGSGLTTAVALPAGSGLTTAVALPAGSGLTTAVWAAPAVSRASVLRRRAALTAPPR